MAEQFTRGRYEEASHRLGVVVGTIAWAAGVESKHVVLAASVAFMAAAGGAAALLSRAFAPAVRPPEAGESLFPPGGGFAVPEDLARSMDAPGKDRTLLFMPSSRDAGSNPEPRVRWPAAPASRRPPQDRMAVAAERPAGDPRRPSRPGMEGRLEPFKIRGENPTSTAHLKAISEELSEAADGLPPVPEAGPPKVVATFGPRRTLVPLFRGEGEEREGEEAEKDRPRRSKRSIGSAQGASGSTSAPAYAGVPGQSGVTDAPRIVVPGNDRHVGAGMIGPSAGQASPAGRDDGQKALRPFGN